MEPTKILVVDDSKLMHKMYEVMLRDYTVITAFDGREALSKLREHPNTDLIFLDINMPNMNGLEFLAARADTSDARVQEIPVVIISTEGKEEDTQRGLEAGAVAYIRKPFRRDEISDVISRVMEGSTA